ncbi:MAG: metal-dependent transcriptional regulator [Roseiflexaceae bacterium]|nr:metal-dependent transcriptional regulator [Roseiflexaceae bacterium]
MSVSAPHIDARKRQGHDGPTDKMREYLEVIYYLSTRSEPVIAARLAEWMRVTAPTVTNIVKRMEEKAYITRDARGEISLTSEGFDVAENVVKRHRILERFLVDIMKVPWHMIHEEAVRLEPALSPLMEERIADLVREATTCPHGNPIPGRGEAHKGTRRLIEAAVGEQFTLRRITEEAEEDTDLMRYIQESGIVPGATFTITGSSPAFGVTLHRDERSITVSPQVAAALWGD